MVERSSEKAGVDSSILSLGTSSYDAKTRRGQTPLGRGSDPIRILFVCVENAGRSQMAEGFARALVPPGVEVFSAGSRPAATLNPVAVTAMREKGIDISQAHPKGFDALAEGLFDVVVGMGCGEACPAARARQILTWEIPNPKGLAIEAVRQIRDTIEVEVKKLIAQGWSGCQV